MALPSVMLHVAGVGKTELAKALATYLFNTEDAMVRIHNGLRLLGLLALLQLFRNANLACTMLHAQ